MMRPTVPDLPMCSEVSDACESILALKRDNKIPAVHAAVRRLRDSIRMHRDDCATLDSVVYDTLATSQELLDCVSQIPYRNIKGLLPDLLHLDKLIYECIVRSLVNVRKEKIQRVSAKGRCMACGELSSKSMRLSTCVGCSCVSYCSRECQKLDWGSRHRSLCKTYSNLRKSVGDEIECIFVMSPPLKYRHAPESSCTESSHAESSPPYPLYPTKSNLLSAKVCTSFSIVVCMNGTSRHAIVHQTWEYIDTPCGKVSHLGATKTCSVSTPAQYRDVSAEVWRATGRSVCIDGKAFQVKMVSYDCHGFTTPGDYFRNTNDGNNNESTPDTVTDMDVCVSPLIKNIDVGLDVEPWCSNRDDMHTVQPRWYGHCPGCCNTCSRGPEV